MSDPLDDLIDALVELMEAKIQDARADNGMEYVGDESKARMKVRAAFRASMHELIDDRDRL